MTLRVDVHTRAAQRSYLTVPGTRGCLCGCGFPIKLGAKVKTMKFSSGVSGGAFTKVCTRENYLLYGTYHETS